MLSILLKQSEYSEYSESVIPTRLTGHWAISPTVTASRFPCVLTLVGFGRRFSPQAQDKMGRILQPNSALSGAVVETQSSSQ
jgi:hypothetical protein